MRIRQKFIGFFLSIIVVLVDFAFFVAKIGSYCSRLVAIAHAESMSATVLVPNPNLTKKSIMTKAIGGETSMVAVPDESGNIPDSAYTVVNETTDMADLGNGNVRYRIYEAPRAIFKDTGGKLKIRPADWYLFNEFDEAKIKENTAVAGYAFAVPFSDNQQVKVTAGAFSAYDGAIIAEPASGRELIQSRAENRLTSVLRNVYPDIDIRFRDFQQLRQKEIVIRQKLESVSSRQQVVFWENYTLPNDAQVFIDNESNPLIGETITGKPVIVKVSPNGYFSVSPAVIFDSKYDDPVYVDLNQQTLRQIVHFDEANNLLEIGILVEGGYLNDPNRTYPIIIDPVYKTYCSGTGLSGCNTWQGVERR